ncbi:MAG: Trk system potassium transporter TrkA [Clostridia bacterium]|nr:Trk system potassium transporter TrkA [Clostridia bacterium]
MKIVVIGLGKIGLTLTEYLSKEGNDVTVVDTDPAVVESAVNSFDVMGVTGNGVNYSVQLEAGVKTADIMIAMTSTDEMNMLCCLVAKKVGVKHTIARIRDPEYSSQFMFMLDEMGLDMVVNPEMESAREIARSLRFPAAIKIDTFAKGRVDLVEMKISQGSILDGIKVFELQKKLNVKLLVCAVLRGDEVFIPSGHFTLMAGDRIHFTASHSELVLFFKTVDKERMRTKRVFLIGGGRIAYYLSDQLLEIGMSVKIVEKDKKRALELSELLPKADIVYGDATDQELLAEENFDSADTCVALTGVDEENMILSMYANQRQIKKVITKVNKPSLVGILKDVGLDTVISPKQITTNMILSYVRAMNNSGASSIKTLYKLVDDRVEALEFYVSENSDVTDKPLRELSLKKNMLISCIIRQNAIIIPGGNDSIKVGDSVVVVTANENLSVLDDILA